MIGIAVTFLLMTILMVAAFNTIDVSVAYAQRSSGYLNGEGLGLVLGSNLGSQEGINARNLGSQPDPVSNYQPPTEGQICSVYVDAKDYSQGECDTRQQEVDDFFQGFSTGYETGYYYGYLAGYYLDEHFPSEP